MIANVWLERNLNTKPDPTTESDLYCRLFAVWFASLSSGSIEKPSPYVWSTNIASRWYESLNRLKSHLHIFKQHVVGLATCSRWISQLLFNLQGGLQHILPNKDQIARTTCHDMNQAIASAQHSAAISQGLHAVSCFCLQIRNFFLGTPSDSGHITIIYNITVVRKLPHCIEM